MALSGLSTLDFSLNDMGLAGAASLDHSLVALTGLDMLDAQLSDIMEPVGLPSAKPSSPCFLPDSADRAAIAEPKRQSLLASRCIITYFLTDSVDKADMLYLWQLLLRTPRGWCGSLVPSERAVRNSSWVMCTPAFSFNKSAIWFNDLCWDEGSTTSWEGTNT